MTCSSLNSLSLKILSIIFLPACAKCTYVANVLKAQHFICVLQVVKYYVRCVKTNNHTVREAACSCIAELFAKIERDAVRPYLQFLQNALFRAFKDDSWTVGSFSYLVQTKSRKLRPAHPRTLLSSHLKGVFDDYSSR